MKKAILVGASSFQDDSFLNNLDNDTFTVACDGGYLVFQKKGLEPDLFIGDYDTLPKEELNHPKEVISLNTIKDDTDIFFAIKELLKRGYHHFELYGCLGNKLDHTLANISLLSYLYDHDSEGLLFDDNNVVFLLTNSTYTFPSTAKGMISIFSFTEESRGVTITNMKYNLQEATLTSSIPLGISNEFLSKESSIEVKQGKLIIITNKANIKTRAE